MERKFLEGEQTTTALLDHGVNGNGDSEMQSDDASAATTIVVISTLVACCGSYVFGAAVGYSSPAESGIMEDLGLSDAGYSVFGSILTVGALLGAIMCGKMADLFGRKGTMGFSEIFCIGGWLAIAFAKLMITTGLSMTYVVGIVVNWRILALIGTIPCLLQLLGLYFIPESPRWLALVGRWLECETALQRLRGKNANISEEEYEIRDYTETLQLLPNPRICDLFQRKYAHSLIVGVGLMVLQQFGGVNAIGYYASAIFESAGFSSSIGTIAIAVVQVPMTLVGVLLMDRVGRRPLLMISAAGTSLGSFLIGLSFLLQELEVWQDLTPIMAVVGAVGFRGMFSFGMGGIPWVMMSEIFPINMKVLGGSLVTAVNWFFTWIVSYSFTFSMDWSSDGTFFIFSIMGGLTVLFVAKLVPETKGRTLEEIQASMNPFPES